jgi:hypothetical protein
MREIAIAAGATVVTSRELVEALYAAGLRKRPHERHGRPKNVAPHQP